MILELPKFQPGDTYTGIGSRQTPLEIIQTMIELSSQLQLDGLVLRSGGADGADSAFELGAGNKKEVYLPWKGFNNNDSLLYSPSIRAFEIAQQFHPVWSELKHGSKALMARNAHQVLGADLASPSKFIVCWTVDGADGVLIPTTKETGGTGLAIRIAAAYKIPVFNLNKPKTMFS